MGLADLILGGSNPFAQYADANQNKIRGAFAGLGTGQNFSDGLANAARGAAAGGPADTAALAAADAKATQQKQVNATLEYLKGRYPDLAQAVMAGYPISSAWSDALARQNPNAKSSISGDINQRLAAGQNLGLSGADLTTFALTGKMDQQNSTKQTLTQTIQERLDAGKAQGLSGPDLTAFGLTGNLPGSNRSTRAGLGQPIPYKSNKTGKMIAVEPMSDGTAVDISTGQPVDTSEYGYDPYGLAAAKTGGQVDAKTAANARALLPGAEQNYQLTMQALSNFDPGTTNDAAKGVQAGEDEQFGKFLGMPTGQVIPAIPGTNKSNFQNLIKQLSGQAFINIRQALKGAGQVTDYEGAKGQDAISRMELASNSGDQTAFQQALADFTQAVDNGMALLRQQANADNSADPSAVPGMPPGQGPSGTTYTYNPSTGNLE